MRFLIVWLLVLGSFTFAKEPERLPIYLHQMTYTIIDTPFVQHRTTIDFVTYAKNNWHFDGVVLSMDCLIQEFGSHENNFHRSMLQLAADLQDLGVRGKFDIAVDIDFSSIISKDLGKTTRQMLTREVFENLPIVSYYSRLEEKSLHRAVWVAPVIVTVKTGRDWTKDTFKHDLKECVHAHRNYRNSSYIAIRSSTPLSWSLREDGVMDLGSDKFEQCVNILQRKKSAIHKGTTSENRATEVVEQKSSFKTGDK